MCITVRTVDGRHVGSQYEFSKLAGVTVKRLPLWRAEDGAVMHSERSLIGRGCLCPIDIAKALSEARLKWRREDDGNFVIEAAD